MEAKMNFSMPRYADANDIVDRALRANARDVPVSMANTSCRRCAGISRASSSATTS